MPTARLTIQSGLLDARLATALAAAFPCLTHLSMPRAEQLTSEASCAPLVTLFSSEIAAPATGGGSRGGGAPGCMLLTSLELLNAWHLSGPLCTALRRCDRLRELDLHNTLELSANDTGGLAALTQLRALRLQGCTRVAVAALCSSLTALTSLDLGGSCLHPVLSALALTALTGLRTLALQSSKLELDGLGALAQLTSLEVHSLVPVQSEGGMAPGVEEGRGRLGASAGIVEPHPLPPRLQRLVLHSDVHCAEVLACLRPPACLARLELCGEVQHLRLYQQPAYVSSAGALLPEGAEALRAALGLLARAEVIPGLKTLHVTYCSLGAEEQALLLPVGGGGGGSAVADGGGGGREGHGAWLAALGGVAARDLHLIGLALSERDLQTIARGCTTLEELCIGECTFPTAALPALARLPKLRSLMLDVQSCWTPGGPHHVHHIAVPPEAAQALLALCTAAAPRLRRLLLFSQDYVAYGDGDVIAALAAEVQGLLTASGLDPCVVEVQWGAEETDSDSASGSDYDDEGLGFDEDGFPYGYGYNGKDGNGDADYDDEDDDLMGMFL